MFENYKMRKAENRARKVLEQTQKLKVKLAYAEFLILKDKIENSQTPTNQEVIKTETTNQKAQTRELVDGTYFVKPSNLIAMRVALKNHGISAKVVKSGGKDWFVEPKGNTDNFNKKMREIDSIVNLYHWSEYTRQRKEAYAS